MNDEFSETLTIDYTCYEEDGSKVVVTTLSTPQFDKALQEFLGVCVAIYQWSPGEIRSKARDAIDDWLT